MKKCAGFLGPCKNPVDLECTIKDPDGKESPVFLCRLCWEASEGLFGKISTDPKLKDRFVAALEAAEVVELPSK